MMKMDLEYKHKILFITLKGSLNRYYTYEINNYVVPIILKYKIKTIIMDFKYLNNIDEYGLYSISNISLVVRKEKGRLYINNCNNIIARKLKPLNIIKDVER